MNIGSILLSQIKKQRTYLQFKGGIDGPAGAANAGALPGALRNAGPLLPL